MRPPPGRLVKNVKKLEMVLWASASALLRGGKLGGGRGEKFLGEGRGSLCTLYTETDRQPK